LLAADTPSSTETQIKLSYFKQITTPVKTYNKQAVISTTTSIAQETTDARQAHFTQAGSSSDSEADEVVSSEGEIEDEANGETAGEAAKVVYGKAGRKVYERAGTESSYQEDTEYLSFRNKKLMHLDKKDKHLLMYSNINQLNYVDINKL
jgi:hypothetical protein